jgi:hypothetical protein
MASDSAGAPLPDSMQHELMLWNQALQAYRAQSWDICSAHITQLIGINPKNSLYAFYARRIALLRLHSPGVAWDGTNDFDAN